MPNTTKKYQISEKELRTLLDAYHRLAALEYGGVDNWEWYGESISDYLNGYEDFDDIVNEEIKKYAQCSCSDLRFDTIIQSFI